MFRTVLLRVIFLIHFISLSYKFLPFANWFKNFTIILKLRYTTKKWNVHRIYIAHVLNILKKHELKVLISVWSGWIKCKEFWTMTSTSLLIYDGCDRVTLCDGTLKKVVCATAELGFVFCFIGLVNWRKRIQSIWTEIYLIGYTILIIFSFMYQAIRNIMKYDDWMSLLQCLMLYISIRDRVSRNK